MLVHRCTNDECPWPDEVLPVTCPSRGLSLAAERRSRDARQGRDHRLAGSYARARGIATSALHRTHAWLRSGQRSPLTPTDAWCPAAVTTQSRWDRTGSFLHHRSEFRTSSAASRLARCGGCAVRDVARPSERASTARHPRRSSPHRQPWRVTTSKCGRCTAASGASAQCPGHALVSHFGRSPTTAYSVALSGSLPVARLWSARFSDRISSAAAAPRSVASKQPGSEVRSGVRDQRQRGPAR